MAAGTEATPRVALLARAGEACDRISQALAEAGAEVVLVADPMQAGPHEVRQAMPEAILVALDPTIEDAIERHADVLADPAYMVIFEEAEQAAQRTGWDAARWLRHLSAKLHRHDDVLPAGAEPDEVLLPTPGPLPSTAGRVDYDQAIAAVTGGAQERAEGVPRDSVSDGPAGGFPGIGEAPPAGVSHWSVDEGDATPADAPDPASAQAQDDPAAGIAQPSLDAAGDGTGEDELAFDPERFQRAGPAAEAVAGIEEFLAAQLRQAADEAPDVDGPPAVAAPPAEPAGAAPAPTVDFGSLSLADDDAPPAPAPAPGAAAAAVPAVDLDSLGAGLSLADPDSYGHGPLRGAVVTGAGLGGPAAGRQLLAGIPARFARAGLARSAPGAAAAAVPAVDLDSLGAGLSLADPDSYGHGPLRGAVVIEAGLGGPDAVRQLLAGIPAGFARPVLVRLALDGGRYDRLVKQMSRATQAPVSVAEDGHEVRPGQVYFVPPGI